MPTYSYLRYERLFPAFFEKADEDIGFSRDKKPHDFGEERGEEGVERGFNLEEGVELIEKVRVLGQRVIDHVDIRR